MSSAVERNLPDTRHLYCIWHTFQNVTKKCSGALVQGAFEGVMGSLRSAAFAPTEEVRSTTRHMHTVWARCHGLSDAIRSSRVLPIRRNVADSWCHPRCRRSRISLSDVRNVLYPSGFQYALGQGRGARLRHSSRKIHEHLARVSDTWTEETRGSLPIH